MDNKIQTNVKYMAVIGGVIAALLITLWYLWRIGVLFPSQDCIVNQPSQDLGVPQSWRGITPGQTSLNEVIQLLGEPDEIKETNECTVYHYVNRDGWGWYNIEILFADRDNSLLAIGIVLSFPNQEAKLPFQSIPGKIKLLDFGVEYGQPDKVTWNMTCGYRVVIWARRGVAVSVSIPYGDVVTLSEVNVQQVKFFEPVTIDQYLNNYSFWPFGIQPYPQNPCPPGSSSSSDIRVNDPRPEDPFDWDDLLMPTSTP